MTEEVRSVRIRIQEQLSFLLATCHNQIHRNKDHVYLDLDGVETTKYINGHSQVSISYRVCKNFSCVKDMVV